MVALKPTRLASKAAFDKRIPFAQMFDSSTAKA